jgi:hypothetical protein
VSVFLWKGDICWKAGASSLGLPDAEKLLAELGMSLEEDSESL